MVQDKKDLQETKIVKFFPGDKEKREEVLAMFPNRWSNDSHFIRAACQHYITALRKEKVEK